MGQQVYRKQAKELQGLQGYQATGLKVKRATVVTGLPGTQGHRETRLQGYRKIRATGKQGHWATTEPGDYRAL